MRGTAAKTCEVRSQNNDRKMENYELNERSHPAPFQTCYYHVYYIISYFLVNPSIYKQFSQLYFPHNINIAIYRKPLIFLPTSSSPRQAPCSINHSFDSHIGAVLFLPCVCEHIVCCKTGSEVWKGIGSTGNVGGGESVLEWVWCHRHDIISQPCHRVSGSRRARKVRLSDQTRA